MAVRYLDGSGAGWCQMNCHIHLEGDDRLHIAHETYWGWDELDYIARGGWESPDAVLVQSFISCIIFSLCPHNASTSNESLALHAITVFESNSRSVTLKSGSNS